MKKRKIAYLTTQFNEVISGPGRFTEYLKLLDFEDLEIHFFSQQIQEEKSGFHPVLQPAWSQKIPFSSLFRAWYFSRTVLESEKRQNFDFVLSADYSMAIFLPEVLLKKTFVMVNDPKLLNVFSRSDGDNEVSARKRWSRILGHFIEKAVVRKSKMAVSNSLYTSQLIEEKYRVSADRIRLLYKAVDLSFFKFSERKVFRFRRFLFVKNDWFIGGLDLIFEAISQLPFQKEIEFTIVGIEGKDKNLVEELGWKFGFAGKIEIVGLVKKDQILEYFRKADLFINFSRKEALGVSCLEAMASGIPVLASDAGGLKEVLDFGNAGFMVPKENVELLVSKLMEIEKSPQMLLSKVQNANRQVGKFSLDSLRESFQNLFRD